MTNFAGHKRTAGAVAVELENPSQQQVVTLLPLQNTSTRKMLQSVQQPGLDHHTVLSGFLRLHLAYSSSIMFYISLTHHKIPTEDPKAAQKKTGLLQEVLSRASHSKKGGETKFATHKTYLMEV